MSTIYDNFFKACELVKDREDFYLLGEHDQICIGLENVEEESELGQKLIELGLVFDSDVWIYYT